MDVDASRDLVERLGISSVPTVLLFANGNEIERFEGVTPEHVLRKSLEQAGATQAIAGRPAGKQVAVTSDD